MKPNLLAALLCVVASPALGARDTEGADWPQWRGPDRTGISVEAAWSPVGQPEPLWRKDLGLGHSSFAVAGGRAYTLGFDAEAGLDTVFCLDAASGEELWSHSYPAEIWDLAHDGGALTTPAVVGEVVYTSNREGKVFCFQAEDGAVLWSRDLRTELELEPPTWGFSASPLVVGDQLIMNVDRVVALDRNTGNDLWVTERNYGIAYSTPAPFEHEGVACLASLSGDGLAVLKLDDGGELAFHEWIKNPQIYPMTPVVIDDRIFISAGYERGALMLRFTGDGLEELWSSRIMRNKMSGCILYDGHLFGFDESILKCIDLDGNQRWRKRGLGTGSMTIAGGRMVILDGKGQLIIAEANPEEYVELSIQDVFDDGTAWSSPVLSHGRVYCRSSKGAMACLDYTGTGAVPASAPVAAKLPAPEDVPTSRAIVARHVAALAAGGFGPEVTSVHLSGQGESLRNTVRAGSVELDWAAERGFAWRDESGFQVAHNQQLGWVAGGRGGPRMLEGNSLAATREAGDLARLRDPSVAYASLGEPGTAVFDNRACFTVPATTAEGFERTLYFEVATGLYAGHQGDGILMWTVADYRDFDGVLLPSRWAFYEPSKGEMNSAVFDTAAVNAEVAEGAFDMPALVKLLSRSPEEIEAANVELTEAHADVLGAWRGSDSEPEDPNLIFRVEEGFLVLIQPERGPTRLSEPEGDGVLVVVGAEYVTFTPELDAEGNLEALQIRMGEELRDRLVRAADED